MKTVFILLIILSFAFFGFAQNQPDVTNKTERDLETVIVSPPEFTGVKDYMNYTHNGPSRIKAYVASNINYPQESIRCGQQGTEVVKFTVTAEGEVENIRIINHVCPEIDSEMTRVLKSTNGMWKPGLRDEQPSNMEYEMYLTFSLENNVEDAKAIFIELTKKYFVAGSRNLYLKHKARKAEKQFDQAITLWPYDSNLLLMRGICRLERGNIEGARSDWERFEELSDIDMNITTLNEAITQSDSYNEFLSLMQKE
ncbi:MAG: energy transducer TonB [Draconibacterium sp.]